MATLGTAMDTAMDTSMETEGGGTTVGTSSAGVTTEHAAGIPFQGQFPESGWATLTLPDIAIDSMRVAGTGLAASAGTVTSNEAQVGARSALITQLLAPHIEEDTAFLTANNPVLYRILSAVTFNPGFVRMNHGRRIAEQQSRRFVFEVMIAWLARWFNIGSYLFPLILLSLWAWKESVPKGFWGLLCSWRLLYYHDTVELLLCEMGERLVAPFAVKASRKVMMAVGDNCLSKFGTNFEGNRDIGDGDTHHLYINWFSVLLGGADESYPTDFDPASDSEFPTPNPLLLPLSPICPCFTTSTRTAHFRINPQAFGIKQRPCRWPVGFLMMLPLPGTGPRLGLQRLALRLQVKPQQYFPTQAR